MWAVMPAGQPGIAFGFVAGSSAGAGSAERSVPCPSPETTAGPSASGALSSDVAAAGCLGGLAAAAVVARQL